MKSLSTEIRHPGFLRITKKIEKPKQLIKEILLLF